MAKISDLSGDEREQRIAELKRKMQESASKNKTTSDASQEADAPAEPAPSVAAEETSVASDTQPAEALAPTATPTSAEAEEGQITAEATGDIVTEAVATEAVVDEAAPVESSVTDAAPSGNGAVAPADLAAATVVPTEVEIDPEIALRKEMNRREFLTYTWGAALGLLLLQSGVASFLFMYPRFKEGEFGGKFNLGDVSTMPDPTDGPQAWPDGKFWLVSTEEDEPKALYMVCTHLGCLYKWVPENFRFECPCHGSKFSHDGFYIDGPASRSLDYFATDVAEDGSVSVDTGKKVQGGPAMESPAREV